MVFFFKFFNLLGLNCWFFLCGIRIRVFNLKILVLLPF